jgi:hypothetical protein
MSIHSWAAKLTGGAIGCIVGAVGIAASVTTYVGAVAMASTGTSGVGLIPVAAVLLDSFLESLKTSVEAGENASKSIKNFLENPNDNIEMITRPQKR